jgi:hypothetical protein
MYVLVPIVFLEHIYNSVTPQNQIFIPHRKKVTTTTTWSSDRTGGAGKWASTRASGWPAPAWAGTGSSAGRNSWAGTCRKNRPVWAGEVLEQSKKKKVVPAGERTRELCILIYFFFTDDTVALQQNFFSNILFFIFFDWLRQKRI